MIGLIQPLARGLSILHAFRSREQYLRNKEIAAAVQLPLATTNRLIKTLTHPEYLVASGTLFRSALIDSDGGAAQSV
jgi:DNA-binding IclR family transcriptional regulator